MRVRASAGKSSFRRKPTLEQLQKQAQEHLEKLKLESESRVSESPAMLDAKRLRHAPQRTKLNALKKP